MLGEDDIDAFYSINEFAQVAVWQGQSINVIFDKLYAEQLGMASNNPMIRASAAKFSGIARNQPVLVDATNYLVQAYKPDGRGEIMIELVKA